MASQGRLELPQETLDFTQPPLMRSLTLENTGGGIVDWFLHGALDGVSIEPKHGEIPPHEMRQAMAYWYSCIPKGAKPWLEFRDRSTNKPKKVAVRFNKPCPYINDVWKKGCKGDKCSPALRDFIAGYESLRQGDFPAAQRSFDAAISLEPRLQDDPEYAVFLGVTKLKNQQPRDAIAYFATTAESDPIGHMLSGIAYSQLGDRRKSHRQYRLALNSESFDLRKSAAFLQDLVPEDDYMAELSRAEKGWTSMASVKKEMPALREVHGYVRPDMKDAVPLPKRMGTEKTKKTREEDPGRMAPHQR